MLRTVLIALMVSGAAFTAAAQDNAPIDPRVAELLDELPTRSDMQGLTENLPDMAGMMLDLKDFAEADRTQTRLDRITNRLEVLVDDFDQINSDDGIPDINAALDELMVIPTDRALMGDLFSLMFELTDVMVENFPEDAQLELERGLLGGNTAQDSEL